MGSLEKALKNFRHCVCDQNVHYSLYIILHYDALPVKKKTCCVAGIAGLTSA